MAMLLVTCVIRSIVGFAGTETVGAAGPAELHPTLMDHAKFVICDHTIDAAQCTLVGVKPMHMIKKRQMVGEAGDEGLTAAELFYALAA
jgi:hypothetical protein